MSHPMLTTDFLYQQQENQVLRLTDLFAKHYDSDKRCKIDLRWYGHPISNNPNVEVDILVSSRKLKGDIESPPDMLFRTHLYEFRIIPTAEFLEWMNAAGYFVELRLFKKHHVGHKQSITSDDDDSKDGTEDVEEARSSEYTILGRPVITYTFTEDISTKSWVLNLNWPDEKNRVSFRGDFYFSISAYRRTDEDVYRRLFSRISSNFRILSKPGVFLQQTKKRKAAQQDDEDEPAKKKAKATNGFTHAPPDAELVPKPPSTMPPVLPPPLIPQPIPLRTLNSVFAPPGGNMLFFPQMPTFGIPPPITVQPPPPQAVQPPEETKVEEEKPKKEPSPEKGKAKKNGKSKKTKNVFFDEISSANNLRVEQELPNSSSPSNLSQTPLLLTSSQENEFMGLSLPGMSQDLFASQSSEFLTSIPDMDEKMSEPQSTSTPVSGGTSPFTKKPRYKSTEAAEAVKRDSSLKMPGSPTTPRSPQTSAFLSPLSMSARGLLSLNFSQESQSDSQSRDWDFFANGGGDGIAFDNIKTPMTVGTGTPTTILNKRSKQMNTNLLADESDGDFYNKVCAMI
jgi:hypothetical protein